MEKGIFEDDLGDMIEIDRGLNVNSVFDTLPALDTEKTEKKIEKTDEKDKTKEEKNSLENIDEVLEKQTLETKKDTEKVEKKVEEDTEEKDDKTPASLVKTTETSSNAPFTVIFARDLVEQGLLSSLDEEKLNEEIKDVGEAEALRNLIRTEIDTNINAAKEDLDLGYQDYLSLLGKGVPQETAGSLIELKDRFDSIKAEELVKEDNTDLRKQVMIDYYKLTTSMPDNKIEKLVQNSIDLGEDIEDSKEFLSTLKDSIKEQITLEEKNATEKRRLTEEENRRSLETLKENINSLGEIVPGVSINKQTKVQMFEAITKPVQDSKGRTTNAIWARRAEDPMFFDERLAYLYATGFFEKNKPWTKATQSKITKEISEFERALKDKSNTASRVGAPVTRTSEQDKNSRDNIDSMRGLFG